ncbi:peptidase S8/S53 domain-containing protein [Stachybotrys elegans]|uniref:Peptidase S8/S53 domain-containing protein n=1 Tax=Stachybotrys elegans TaxID=80388 RepID=A0A8K0WQN9_9HYPO|nr:peptidase S8/S53 domain-containing protein [Stachybotrys elegans]
MRLRGIVWPLLGGFWAAAAVESSESNTSDDSNSSGDFFRDLESVNVVATPRLALSSSLFRGMSFRVDNTQELNETERSILSLSNVKKLWPVQITPRPNDQVIWVADSQTVPLDLSRKRQAPVENAFSPHVMTQVDRLRAEGYTGKGIKIAVIDTGVDYTHPALGGCFGPGCLISHGADLVGDAYNGQNEPVPDGDPMETCPNSFHGTHVTGIIAAQENPFGFTGAAPDTSIGAYKVFGCTGGVANDVLIAAFARAVEDGNDIITASLGSTNGWSDNPTAVALQRIVEAGVTVTVAAGNEGTNGMFFASSGASGKGVTAVGSVVADVDTVIGYHSTFETETSGEEDFGWLEGIPAFGNISLPLYATSNSTSTPDDACNPLPSDTPDLSEYIVLVRRANCSESQQARNIVERGGKYMVVYSGGVNLLNPWVGDVSEMLACASVTAAQGAEWVELLNEGEQVTLHMTEQASAQRAVLNQANTLNGGLVHSTSTWGPTWELDMKPDVVTVGAGVLSTYPLAMGGYAVQSGTSMSTPLAAAIYALIAQARGTTDPTELRRVLSSTAKRIVWAPDPSAGLASVAQQGAGFSQAYDAAFVKTLLSVSSIAFNDTDHLLNSTQFSIENLGTEDMSYDIGHVPAVSLYTFNTQSQQPSRYPNPVADGHAELSFSSTRVSVPAGGSIKITVMPNPPSTLDAIRLPVYSGFITINGTQSDGGAGRNESLSVPYLGVTGSMFSTPIFDRSLFAMYNLSQLIQTSIPNGTFYIPHPDSDAPANPLVGFPFMQLRTRLGTREFRLELVAADGPSQVVGSPAGFPRQFSTRSVNSHHFVGRLSDGSVVPEGRYYFRAQALKVFGDPSDPDAWESESFDTFNLVYTNNPEK